MPSHLPLMQLSVVEFIQFLKDNAIENFYLVYDKEKHKVIASHSQLQELAEEITADKRDFMQHEGMFFQLNTQYDILQAAFIHKTNRGQASGGLRFWKYNTLEDFLRDGMRLSKGMTRKNALANLWWGGGKGILADNPSVDKKDEKIRAEIYRDYGKFITSIKGCYITAEDVGTCEQDMGNVFSQTRFTTCIPASVGGSGNPSSATALGVVHGMEAALDFLGMGDLSGKTVVVQGMGHVAEPMIGYMFARHVAKIIAADINAELINTVKAKYADKNFEARLVDIQDNSILFEACDILAPCATGAILNAQSIANIKAKIVCGAANNQLKDSSTDGQLLAEAGITYVPDFLVNRMGIVNCADEQSGYIDNDPYFYRHLEQDDKNSVYQTAKRVLAQAKTSGKTPAEVAIELADELSHKNHPIYGHRGEKIIASLVKNNWARSSSS